MKVFCSYLLFFLLTSTNFSYASESVSIKKIDGRHWLIDAKGKPFFAHGVTHINQKKFKDRQQLIAKSLNTLGFNSFGYGCPPELKKELPYLEGQQSLETSDYRGSNVKFIDIFDAAEQAKLEAKVKRLCDDNKDNPNLIAYCWTDLGAWPLKNSTKKNWVEFIKKLPENSPGKKTYNKYLSSSADKSDSGFLRLIAREYFRVMGQANKKYDPKHMIFGDRYSFNTIVPEVLEEMLPWVDAIAIQPPFTAGFPKNKFDELYRLTGKPIIICDFAIRFKDGDKNIKGKLEDGPKDAGEAYSKYIKDALQTPYILGSFWCNPSDSVGMFSKSGIKQGLLNSDLEPRSGLSDALITLNDFIKKNTAKPEQLK